MFKMNNSTTNVNFKNYESTSSGNLAVDYSAIPMSLASQIIYGGYVVLDHQEIKKQVVNTQPANPLERIFTDFDEAFRDLANR